MADKAPETKVEEDPKAAADPTTTKDEEGGEGAEEAHYESTAVFEPVVQLKEVETKTHEEEEDALYKMRSKLYVFAEAMLDKGTGKKQWLERGIGEVKLLRHRDNQRIRLLMRQEKTMKVIANHAVDPRITIQPNVGSDRSWVWTAFDYSEGELREETFALRFGKPQDAEEFKAAFEDAKKTMQTLLAGEDAPGGSTAEADEASEAIASLSVKAEGGEAAKAEEEPKKD